MTMKTADLCDQFGAELAVAEPIFRDFGGKTSFSGEIATVEAHDDNSKVRESLEESGAGRVLVIHGQGSRRCALLGDMLADLAVKNGWSGIIVNGCVRDSEVLARTGIGIKAIAAHPRKSEKRGGGKRDVPVAFAGITFVPGDLVYADPDGVVVLKKERAPDHA
jgi:regulator of ribonuclease activity A